MDNKDFKKVEAKDIEDDGTLNASIKMALGELKKDERVYSLIRDQFKLKQSEVKASMVPFLNLLEDLHYCDRCPGLEKCDKPTPHYQIELSKEGGVIRTNYRLCPLAKEKREYDSAFLYRDFPDEWWKKSVNHDVDRTKTKSPALIKAAQMLSGDCHDWLYLRGRRRSGRSFLLACLANDFARKGKKVAFAETSRLVEELKELSIHGKKEFEQKMADLCACDLLVLDDFGNENHTAYVYSSIIFPLLNARAKEEKATAFTSDFSFEAIVGMYRDIIGLAKASQLKNLLEDFCRKAIDVTSLDLH